MAERDDHSDLAKILVVDDNAFTIEATRCMLQQYSLDSDQAIDGLEAFELVKQRF